MKKREFLQKTSLLAVGSTLTFPSCMNESKITEPITNWSGNLIYATKKLKVPNSLDELAEIIKKNSRFKLLGSQHCFNDIADSDTLLVSTRNLNKIISIDKNALTVTVEPGIKYGQLADYLIQQGYALNNLASLPHISVGGAIATATHGSGIKNGNLSSQVSGLEILTANGETILIDQNTPNDLLNACTVHLGALGIITKVILKIEPAFEVRQDVWENLPFASLKDNLIPILSAGYSVSLFTDWMNDSVSEVWIKSKLTSGQPFLSPTEFFGAKPATKNIHPIIELDAINCTDQMGVPGSWHERLPHFKMNFTPSSGKELQSEYFVPIEHAYEALYAINSSGAKWKNDLFISEIRTIAKDDLWMSTASGRESLAIHFTWKQQDNVYKLIPEVEALIQPFSARPHWGKLFTFSKDYIQSVYPKYNDFVKLKKDMDPEGKFTNKYLQKVFG